MFKPLPGRYSNVGSAAVAAVASFFNSTCCSFRVVSSCSSALMRLSRSSACVGPSENKQMPIVRTRNNVQEITRVMEPPRCEIQPHQISSVKLRVSNGAMNFQLEKTLKGSKLIESWLWIGGKRSV